MADARFSLRSLLRPWQIARGRLAPLLARRRTPEVAPPAEAITELPAEPAVAVAVAVAAPVAAPATASPAAPSRVWGEQTAPQWLRVGWELSAVDRQRLQQGGAGLALRLSDQASAGAPGPQAVMELLVDATATGWELPVPLGGRSYRLSLGLRLEGGGWQELTATEGLWVEPALEMAPQPQPLSFPEPEPLAAAALPAESPSGLDAGVVHERSYQRASRSWRRIGLGSESLLVGELGADDAAGGPGAAGLDSGAGLWASGRDSGSGGVPARQRRFWLVADAELIVHGATDPAASLRVGEAAVPLSEAGTFRIHVPFADGEQSYPIHATAADGEQQRHVRLDFSRTTPERRTNRADQASDEWF